MSAVEEAFRIRAVCVGTPRPLDWQGRRMLSAIFKAPLEGRRRVRRLGIEGDAQSDLSVHGGENKAVYAYPSDHYPAWRAELEVASLPAGSFGENLTVDGVLEDRVRIGDRFRLGTAEGTVTQPRMPCLKLQARFARSDMNRRFLASGRSGFYLRIDVEGEVGPGDGMVRLARGPSDLTVLDMVRLYTGEAGDPDLVRRAAGHPDLPADWRERIRERFAGLLAGGA